MNNEYKYNKEMKNVLNRTEQGIYEKEIGHNGYNWNESEGVQLN